jgi:hypothetical protein
MGRGGRRWRGGRAQVGKGGAGEGGGGVRGDKDIVLHVVIL